jgi:hypothetical protein
MDSRGACKAFFIGFVEVLITKTFDVVGSGVQKIDARGC